MSDRIERELEACRAAGQPVALAQVVSGPGRGARLLVWPGGQALGSLGAPRLNQRVALYMEGLLERGGTERKSFELPDGKVEIETTVYRGAVRSDS